MSDPLGGVLPPPVLDEEAVTKKPSLRKSLTGSPKGRVLFQPDDLATTTPQEPNKRRSRNLEKGIEHIREMFSKEEAADSAKRTGQEWSPEQGLPGMDFNPEDIQDPVQNMKVLEMLQALDRTTEELMGQKVSNEELMGFLEMGEKRIVDLAVKVKLLEDQNERLALKDTDQAQEIDKLKYNLATSQAHGKKLESEKEHLLGDIHGYADQCTDLKAHLESIKIDKTRESELNAELKKAYELKEDTTRKEREKVAAEQRVTVQNLERDKRRLQERLEEWHRKSDQNVAKSKQLEKELKDKTREVEKLQTELANLQRSYKNDKVKMDNALSNGKMHIQEEMVRLHSWDKELTELSEKLKKSEAKLDKEKENIKRAIADSVKEVQAQREAEHRLLLDMKHQYEQELMTQFEQRQNELDEHWRQKETVELEQLEERRNALDSELQMKTQKAAENRQRLERYSQNLERYGRRLKGEYENWQHEKNQVYGVLAEAQTERETAETEMKKDIDVLTAAAQDIHLQLEGKKAVIEELDIKMKELMAERNALLEEKAHSEENDKDRTAQMKELTAENDRLIEDNTLLERSFNELKCEHDQLLEEMTYMRSREEEERELRRKTNEMLLASYKIKNPQSGVVLPVGHRSGTYAEGIDLLCWKCHQGSMDEEGTGLLARTRDARKQMRSLNNERTSLHNDKQAFIKAHKLDAEKLTRETETIKNDREVLRQETEKVIAERKAIASVSQLDPKLAPPTPLKDDTDPDHNPVKISYPSMDAPEAPEAPLSPTEASRRRKKDLIYLKSIYSSPKRMSHNAAW
eukprot:TRINITY_DN10383_c2_g1_i1.p1 TRINITY_DN10383_c2_g1~~TRINITY_DN10383_c2_g1_i1.p1  ORF type:complete len:818 (+),score=261.64 TRINITY_DN10383_c2_g1_i1:39-2456(+)